MARINHVITYGIGTPGDIEHIILMELNIAVGLSGEVLSLYDRDITTIALPSRYTGVISEAKATNTLINCGIGAQAGIPQFILMGLRQTDFNDSDGLLELPDREAIADPITFDFPRWWGE